MALIVMCPSDGDLVRHERNLAGIKWAARRASTWVGFGSGCPSESSPRSTVPLNSHILKAGRSRLPYLTGRPRAGCSRLSALAGRTRPPVSWVFSATLPDLAGRSRLSVSWVFSATLPDPVGRSQPPTLTGSPRLSCRSSPLLQCLSRGCTANRSLHDIL